MTATSAAPDLAASLAPIHGDAMAMIERLLDLRDTLPQDDESRGLLSHAITATIATATLTRGVIDEHLGAHEPAPRWAQDGAADAVDDVARVRAVMGYFDDLDADEATAEAFIRTCRGCPTTRAMFERLQQIHDARQTPDAQAQE